MGKYRKISLIFCLFLAFFLSLIFCQKTLAWTLTYDYQTNNGDSVTLETTTYNENDVVDLSVSATKDNWEFVGWALQAEETEPLTSFSMPNQDETLYAIFKRTFTLNFFVNNAQSITASTTGNSCTIYDDLEECEIQSYNITPKTGYDVKGWNISADATTSILATLSSLKFRGNMTDSYDKSYYAITSPIVYNIEYDRNTASFLNDNYETSYTIESIVNLAQVGKYGYIFNGWKPAVNTGNWNINEIHKDTFNGKYGHIKLVANLSPIEIKVNCDFNDGLNQKEYKMVNFGSPLGQLPAKIRPGFVFEGWYMDDNLSHSVNENSILNWTDKETTIHARWSIEPISVGETTDIKKVYDGEYSTSTLQATHNSNLPLTYKWFKCESDGKECNLIENKNDNFLSVKNVNENGVYYANVSLKVNGLITNVNSPAIEVVITPKKIELVDIVGYDKVFDGNSKATIDGGKLTGVVKDDVVSFNLLKSIILPDYEVGKYQVNPVATLKGINATNYELVSVEPVQINILSLGIKSANKIVNMNSLEGFKDSYELYFSDESNNLRAYDLNGFFGKDFYARKMYCLKVTNGQEEVGYNDVQISVKLSDALRQASKFKVLILDDKNIVASSSYKDGYLTFASSNSSVRFVIFSNKYQDPTLKIILSSLLCLLVLSCCFFGTKIIIKNRKVKKVKEVKIINKPVTKNKETENSIHDKYLKMKEENKEKERNERLDKAIKNRNNKKSAK